MQKANNNENPQNKEEFIAHYVSQGVPKKKIQEFQKVFEHYDTDKSGYLVPREIKDAFGTLGIKLADKDIVKIFAQFDQDGDGNISFKEFLDIIFDYRSTNQVAKTIQQKVKELGEKRAIEFKKPNTIPKGDSNKSVSAIPKDKIDKYTRAFKMFDDNDSGSINPKEFMECLRALNHNISKEDALEILFEWDYDGDGKLDLNEFLRGMNGVTNCPATRSFKVIVGELADGRRTLNRPTKDRRQSIRKKIPDEISSISSDGNMDDYHEIMELFSVFDFEDKNDINLKTIKERVNNEKFIPKLNDDDKMIWQNILNCGKDSMTFEEFTKLMSKEVYPANQVKHFKDILVTEISKLPKKVEIDECSPIRPKDPKQAELLKRSSTKDASELDKKSSIKLKDNKPANTTPDEIKRRGTVNTIKELPKDKKITEPKIEVNKKGSQNDLDKDLARKKTITLPTDSKNKNDELVAENDSLKTEMDELKNIIQELKDKNDELIKEKNFADQIIRDLEQDKISLTEKLDNEIEEAQDKIMELQNEIFAYEGEIKSKMAEEEKLIEMIKTFENNSKQFLAIPGEIKDYSNANEIKNRIEYLFDKLKEKTLKLNGEIKNKDEEIESQKRLIEKLTLDNVNEEEEKESKINEINKLNQRLTDKDQEIEIQKIMTEQLRLNLQTGENEKEKQLNQVQELYQKLLDKDGEIQRQKSTIEQLARNLKNAEMEKEKLISGFDQRIVNKDIEIEKQKNMIEQFAYDLNNNENERKQQNNQVNELTQRLEDKNAEIQKQKSIIDQLTDNLNSGGTENEKQLNEVYQRLEEKDAEIEKHKAIIEELGLIIKNEDIENEKKLNYLDQINRQLQNELIEIAKEKNDQIEMLTQESHDSKQKLFYYSHILDEISDKLANLSNGLLKDNEKDQNKEIDCLKLIDNIQTKYETNLQALQSQLDNSNRVHRQDAERNKGEHAKMAATVSHEVQILNNKINSLTDELNIKEQIIKENEENLYHIQAEKNELTKILDEKIQEIEALKSQISFIDPNNMNKVENNESGFSKTELDAHNNRYEEHQIQQILNLEKEELIAKQKKIISEMTEEIENTKCILGLKEKELCKMSNVIEKVKLEFDDKLQKLKKITLEMNEKNNLVNLADQEKKEKINELLNTIGKYKDEIQSLTKSNLILNEKNQKLEEEKQRAEQSTKEKESIVENKEQELKRLNEGFIRVQIELETKLQKLKHLSENIEEIQNKHDLEKNETIKKIEECEYKISHGEVEINSLKQKNTELTERLKNDTKNFLENLAKKDIDCENLKKNSDIQENKIKSLSQDALVNLKLLQDLLKKHKSSNEIEIEQKTELNSDINQSIISNIQELKRILEEKIKEIESIKDSMAKKAEINTNNYVIMIENLKKDKEDLIASNNEFLSQSKEATLMNDNLLIKLETYKNDQVTLTKELKSAKEENISLINQLNITQEKLNNLDKELKDVFEQNQTLIDKVEDLEKKNNQANQDIEKYKEDLNSIEAKLELLNTKNFENENKTKNDPFVQSNDSKLSNEAVQKINEEKLSSQSNELDQAKTNLFKNTQQFSLKLNLKHKELETYLLNLTTTALKLSELENQLANEIALKNKELKTKNQEIDNYKLKITKLERELKQKSQDHEISLKKIEDLNKNFQQNFANSLKTVLESFKININTGIKASQINSSSNGKLNNEMIIELIPSVQDILKNFIAEVLIKENEIKGYITQYLENFETKLNKVFVLFQTTLEKFIKTSQKKEKDNLKLTYSIQYFQAKYEDMRKLAEYEAKNLRIFKQKHHDIIEALENNYQNKIRLLNRQIEDVYGDQSY